MIPTKIDRPRGQRSPSRAQLERMGFKTTLVGGRLVVLGHRTVRHRSYTKDGVNMGTSRGGYEPGRIYVSRWQMNGNQHATCGHGLHFSPTADQARRFRKRFRNSGVRTVHVAAFASESVLPTSQTRSKKMRALHLFTGSSHKECVRLMETFLAYEDPIEV